MPRRRFATRACPATLSPPRAAEARFGWGGATSAPGDALDRLGGTDDRDVLIGLQIEQVRIARNDKIGLRGEGAGEHMIVVRVG